MNLTSKKYSLNKDKTHSFLDELEDSVDAAAMSLYLRPGLSITDVEESISNAGIQSVPEDLPEMVAGSKTGAVVFRSETGIYLIRPPFPVSEKIIFAGFAAEPLRDLLDSDHKIGIVLVHLGSYAVGFCRGEKLVSSKVGTGLVHGRHKKGGSSQQRFQRRRQNQADEFLKRVCEHVIEHLSPHEKDLEYIVYGGPRQTVLKLKKRCRFLQSLEERELSLIEVPTIRQPVLEKAVSRVWSSSIVEWSEE
ncbi:acVLRF1 family peptidyl-tRNA hydrolase [Chloroflexota bacterium]